MMTETLEPVTDELDQQRLAEQLLEQAKQHELNRDWESTECDHLILLN